ncbi:MAG: glycosyltransferase family 87 protein [Candidatus Omnitrophica bacterium]|nr:glycosyltransferase family 87 protein [Candidatus Omnitrophota bacterium]
MKLKKRHFIALIFIPMFFGLFFSYLHRAPKRNYSDFRVYYATAQRFVAHEDIYSRPDEAITPFKYSPTFAMLMAPLALVPQKNASLIFFTFNFVAMLCVFAFCKKIIVQDKTSYGENILLYGACGLFSSRFLLQVLNSGQVTIFMFALIVAGLYLFEKRKEALSGAMLALSVMIKYTSALFLPYFIFRKKRQVAFLIMIFVAFYCLLPALYVGLEKEANYLKKWLPFISDTSLDSGSLYDYKNQSFFSLILRYFTKDSPYQVSILHLSFNQGLAFAFVLGLAIYVMILYRKGESKFYRSLDYSLLFIAMAFFNPNAWMTNFIFLIPAYMFLLYYLIRVRFKDILTIILVALSFALASWGSESIVGNDIENLLEVLSCVTISGLLLMAALFRLKFDKKLRGFNNDYADF